MLIEVLHVELPDPVAIRVARPNGDLVHIGRDASKIDPWDYTCPECGATRVLCCRIEITIEATHVHRARYILAMETADAD